jgi:DNA invertase Pin-like site-specific DNA recombinase
MSAPSSVACPTSGRSQAARVVCRRSTSEPPFDAENRRELASRIYDEYPCRSGIFDTVLFGYARVSTAEQNPDHQIDALIRAGVAAKDIYVDHASGAKASRPELDALLRMLRDGDTVKITRLDRLGRSVLHLVTLGAELRERGVGLHVTEQGIDTTTAEGRAMFGMLSVLAELQRELILANTRDGLAAARARGRTSGRRPRLNDEQVALAQQLYDAGGQTVQQIADLFSVPRTTVYGHLDDASKGKRPAGQRNRRAPPTHLATESLPAGLNADGGWCRILTGSPAACAGRGPDAGRGHPRPRRRADHPPLHPFDDRGPPRRHAGPGRLIQCERADRRRLRVL